MTAYSIEVSQNSHLERKVSAITRSLLAWFDENRRRFPWRETFEKPDPYLILFAEIMLQRTKADQVVPIYQEFVSKYPTFDDLSTARDHDVAALFQRLGLEWRAKNVVRLVRVLRRSQGVVPRQFAELRKLPAVGDYVARAVMCYAFGERTAPVDANVVRVISRLFGLRSTGDSGRRNKSIALLALKLVPKKRTRDLNLAVLDFAAGVCKPKPLCQICPLQKYCQYWLELSKMSQHRSFGDLRLSAQTLQRA